MNAQNRWYKRVVLLVFSVLSFVMGAFAQVDYEFWFAAPYGNIDHAPQWPDGYPYKVGGRPIYLRLATQDADADVTVTLPALGITIANLSIEANGTASVDLTPFIDNIQCSKEGNVKEDKGIYIRSNALITAYYEIASVLNTDIFSLKGQNALGKEFYTPFQNKMSNDTYHNKGMGEEQPTSDYPNAGGVNDNHISDSAFSYIVIVATQDNTTVNITPTANCVGITAGSTKSVKLDRGQTYVVRAKGQDINSRLSGTHIVSTKPIAVTIGEDSAYPDYYTKSGDCEDYIGDQIVPVAVTGRDYVIFQGEGFKGRESGNQGNDFKEIVAITATKDNTVVSVNGAQYGSALNKGQTISIEIEKDDIYTFIHATNPVYAFQISGYHCEVAGAILPSIEMCTGSYKMGFVRTYGSQNDQEFYMNLMVKGDGEHDFLLNGAKSDVIERQTFQQVDGMDWKVARIHFTQSELPEGAYFLQNTTSLFHMGMMNSTSHDWGDGQGYRLMGSMYGYFSRFTDNNPSSIIVNNNDTIITVTRNTKVSLLADGGYKFNWVGYMWDGYDWAEMDSPYYLNKTNVENPYAVIDPVGVYKYTATITTACYGDVERSVIIRVVEPVDLNTVYDTVCYTPGLSPNNDQSQYYNLFNLNDTIVGRKGLVTGFYVDHFDKFVPAETVVWDDFESNRLMSSKYSVGNGTISVVSNPDPNEVNSSETVGYLGKNNANYVQLPGMSGEQAQKSVWLNIDLESSGLNVGIGGKFSFDVRYDSTLTPYGHDEHQVFVDLIDQNDNVVSLLGTSLEPCHYTNNNKVDTLYRTDWEHVELDFSDYKESLTNYKTFRLRIYSGNNWYNKNGNYGYYIDNLQFYTNDRRVTILNRDAKQYTITDKDSLFAIVRNNFEVTRSDTSMVYLTVRNPGIEKRTVQLGDTCATEGNLLKEFNLTDYNYATGGALVADRLWYLDYQRTKPVEDPEFVDVQAGETIFYVYVDDECVDIPGELVLHVYPIPTVTDNETTVCEIPSLGGDQGLVNLTTSRNLVTTDNSATVMWYSDYACTKLVASPESVPVTDNTKFYAKVFYSADCSAFATLTVNVTPLDDIKFDNFSICEDAEPIVLTATPSGGEYSGAGVSLATFNPKTAGTGDHEISYTITNDGCSDTKKATVTVNPQVTVTLENTSGKLQKGQTANLKATVSPASSDYSYTWTDASKLASTSTLTPTTVSLQEPTYYTIEVVNTKTTCSASAKVLVDVYAPVKVALEVEPVCAGKDVEIDANRTGGTGPFTYQWTLSPSVPFTQKNDSVIVIPNVQSDVSVTVKVTDNTENDVVTDTKTQVVYANPTITLSDATVCQGDALALNPEVSGGTPAYTYSWTGDTDILTTAASAQNATVNTKDNVGSYYLTFGVTDKNLCKDEKQISVKVNQKPVVKAAVDTTVSCYGNEVKLTGSVVTGSSNGAKHQWISSSMSTSSLSSTDVPNPVFASYISGVHFFQYIMEDANGCKDTSDVVSIRNEPRPKVTIDAVDDQCVSDLGVTLSANPKVEGVSSATFTYNWTGDVTSTDSNPILDISTPGTKNVSLYVKANNGCISDTASVQVVVNANPLAEIVTKDLSVCAQDTINLRANTSSGNVTYKWETMAKLLSDEGSSVQVIPANPSDDEFEYTVNLTVTDNNTNCFSKTSTKLTSLRLPEISLGDDFSLCDGDTIALVPLIKYAYGNNYTTSWFLDTLQLSSTDVLNPIYTQVGTKTYTIGIQIKDGNGCVTDDELQISGWQNPTANAGEDRIEDWGTPFTLNGSATGGTAPYSYLWSPADSLTSAANIQNPTSSILETTIYTLQVTDDNGCKGSDEVVVTIIGQPLKVTIVQKPDPYCFGNTVTLEAIPSGGTGEYTYEWYNVSDPSTIIATTKSIDVAPTEITAYKVVLNSVGIKHFDPASATHTVIVNALPVISVMGQGDLHVCQGNTINIISSISGVAPYKYQWIDSNSPIIVQTENYLFNNSQVVGNKTVKLIVTDAIGCTDSIDVVVRVDDLPTVSIAPVTECMNVEATAQAVAEKGQTPYSYLWTGIDGLSSLGDKASFTIPTAGSYSVSVQVIDANQCTAETSADVIIKPESDLALDPTYSVCASEDLTLDINPQGIPGNYTMHWVGGDRQRIVDSTIVTQSVFRSDSQGEYTLYYTIADQYNCPKKESTTVTVFPAVKLADIEDKTVCADASLDITAEILTGNPSSFSWLGPVSPKNEKTTTFTSTRDGKYEVTVIAGDQHCSDEKSFNVSVQPNPLVKIVGAPIKVVDYTATTMLTAQIVNYTTSPFTHAWTDEANILEGANTAAITTKPISGTTDYTYTLTDKYGCTATASIRVQTELLLPKIMRFCDGREYEVSADEIVDANVVCLTDDALSLCLGESAYLIPQFISGKTENLTYYWRDDENNSLGSDVNILITPQKEVTKYTLTVTNAAGFSTDVSYTVVAHPLPTAEITVSPEYKGNFYTRTSLVIDGNPSSSEYGVDFVSHAWTTSVDVNIANPSAQKTVIRSEEELPSVVLNYAVVDNNGCKAETSREIALVDQKMPVILGDNVCVNSSAIYKLSDTYSPGTEFIWSVTGGTILGESNTSTVEVKWTETENTVITVSVYPPDDKPVENIVRTVFVTPYPDITINGQVHVCVGETANYEALNNIPEMSLNYSWSIADDHGDLVDISYPVADIASILWDKEGKDTVILSAMYGTCTTRDSLTVYIHPTPNADFKYAATEDVYFLEEKQLRHTDSIFVDKEVTFTNLTGKRTDYEYYWDFIGDGVYTENTYDAVYEYDEAGDFMVSLMVVENTWGCKNVVAKPLTVVPNPNCGLKFPNAFTPDLSENNTFYPVFKAGVLETGYELRVYDRWGTLLWSTTDLFGEWDGVYKGSISKQDVYVYHCKATCEDIDKSTGKHRVLNVKGDVTIIR